MDLFPSPTRNEVVERRKSGKESGLYDFREFIFFNLFSQVGNVVVFTINCSVVGASIYVVYFFFKLTTK